MRTLSMNGWLGYNSEAWDGPGGLIVYRKLSEMVQPGPSGIWVVVDEREDSINDGWFAVSMAGVATPAGKPANPVLRKAEDTALRVPTPGNPDVEWIQAHTTGFR